MFHGRGFPRDHMLSLDSLRVWPVNQGTLTRSRINSAAASESSDDDLEYLGMTPKWLVIIGIARCGKPQYIYNLFIYTIFHGSKFGGFISPISIYFW